MANPIDLIVTKEALQGIDALITKVTTAREGLLSLGNTALDSSKNVSKISTPSGLNNNTALNKQINDDIKKQAQEIEKLHAVIAKKAEASRLAEIRLQQAREKSFDSFEKNTQKEIALNEKNANAYNKTQAQVNRLTVAYNDLAVRKLRYNNLNENEEKRLVTLSAVNEKYNGVLKQTDATIGKNGRNVGNYASGYNALGNSINQLTREAPAFANSIQTGFMALSNNFASLEDAVKGIIAQNRILAAEGKPTVSVFKQLAGGIFSWTTMISVAVTLLTVYGAKIVEFIAGNKEAADSTKSLAEAQKTALEGSVKELSHLDTLRAKVTDINAPMTERLKIVKELQDEYPSYFGNMTTEQILADKTGGAYAQLAKDILASAKARAIAGEIEKIAVKQLAIETEIAENKSGKYNLKNALNFNILAQLKDASSGGNTNTMKAIITNQEKDLKELDAAQQKLLDKYVTINTGKLGSDGKDSKTKVDKSGIKAAEDRLKAVYEGNKSELELQLQLTDAKIENWKTEFDESLVLLLRDYTIRKSLAKLAYDEEVRLAKGNNDKKKEAYNNYQIELSKSDVEYYKKRDDLIKKNRDLELETIRELEKVQEKINEGKDKDEQKLIDEKVKVWIKGFEDIEKKALETAQKLKEASDNYIKSFFGDFSSNSGLSETLNMFDGENSLFSRMSKGMSFTKESWKKDALQMSESAQEMFNFISNASQGNFDNEKKRIEEQQAIAISFAGGSATAIAKINDEAEKRKKDIANREAKAKQKQAIFNIAIDTAQAIVAALPNYVLAGIVAAIGAIQIGIVASQKVPQYFDGTDNHIGGLMMVNDGKGANYKEKVVLPSGQEILPQGRNVLMNAPKGTKVLTHEQQLFEMMQDNGISMSQTITKSNGMTANEMDCVLGKHFSNIKTVNNYVDQKGFHSYIQNGNSRTIMNQNRVSGSGISV